MSISSDITKRKKAEEDLKNLNMELEKRIEARTKKLSDYNKALQETKRRYQELWNDAPVAYHILDTEGKIVDVNKAEAEMLGYSPKKMVGRFIFDFVKPERREEARKKFRLKISGKKIDKDEGKIYLKRNGSEIYVSSNDNLEKDARRKIIGVRAAMVDVTERKQKEDRLLESYEYLGILNRKISFLLELDQLSHEIKNSKKKISRFILSQLINLSLADGGALFVLPDGKKEKSCSASSASIFRDAEEQMREFEIKICGLAHRLEKEQTIIQGTIGEFDLEKFNINGAFEFFVAIPLIFENKLCAFLLLGFKDKKFISSQDLEFLNIFSTHAVMALLNSRIIKK